MYQTLGLMKIGIRLLILAVSVMALSSCGGNKKVTIKEVGGIKATVELKSKGDLIILKERFEKAGIPNVTYTEEGNKLYTFELPGERDEQRIARLISAEGKLEFWTTIDVSEIPLFSNPESAFGGDVPVDVMPLYSHFSCGNDYNCFRACYGWASDTDTAAVNRLLVSPVIKEYLPAGLRTYWTLKPNFEGKYELIGVDANGNNAPLDSKVITEVSVEKEPTPCININMNERGSKIWAGITRENIGKQIAMVLDGKVLSYPTVMSEITGGKSQITGNFTLQEMVEIAAIIESSKHPAHAIVKEIKWVSPSAE